MTFKNDINSKQQRNDIFWYFSMYKKYIGHKVYFVFLLSIISALLEGFGITLLLPLLSNIEISDVGKDYTFLDNLLNLFHITTTVRIILFISFVFFLKGLFKFFEGAYRARLQGYLMGNLKKNMFVGFEKMNYKYYMSRNTGHFINVINEQINQFCTSFHLYSGFIASIIMATVYFIIAFTIEWQFALVSLVVGLLLLFCLRMLNNFVRKLSRKTAYETGELNKYLVQTLQGFKYAISTNQLKYIKSSIISSINKLSSYLKKTQVLVAFSESIREPIAVGILMSIIAFQIYYSSTQFATIAVALILFYRGIMSITSIQTLWQKVIGRSGSIEIVDKEFSLLSKEKVLDGNLIISPLYKNIVLKKLSFNYEKNITVLEDINMTIPANKTIAIVGKSGSGKSTFVDILTILLKPTKGEVLIDNIPANEIKLTSWRNQIGYVCQESVMFDDSIANNIGMWKGDYNSDKKYKANIHKAAKLARADNFIDELNDGYETLIGDRGIRLSGGQRQRLFIARELFKNPRLLILDEATSALDSESEKYIQESIDFLKGKMAVVIIAHRLSTIKNVDKIYVFEKGRVVQSGSFKELQQSNNTRFRKMIEMQSL